MTIGDFVPAFSLILTAMGTFAGWIWQKHQERKSVTVAIVAEVRALHQIAIERNYLNDLDECAVGLEALPEGKRPFHKFAVPGSQDYARVFTANLTKLGYLKPEDAASVVRFYQYIESVLIDVREGGVLHSGSDDPASFTKAAAILRKAFAEAEAISARYPTS
jgi:hypothetical protein